MNQKKRQKQVSLNQEKKATQTLGIHMMPASGATTFGGGDGRLAGKIRLECKYTEKSSYILRLADLIKLRTQAIKGGLEEPIFLIEFKDQHKAKYVVIPFNTSHIELNKQPSGTTIYSWDRPPGKQCTIKSEELSNKVGVCNLLLLRITFNTKVAMELGNPGFNDYSIMLWEDYLVYREMNPNDGN